MEKKEIQKQINSFMETYKVSTEEFLVSYKAALVYHGIFDHCRDIDLMISPELSYRLEDEFGIMRTTAPMGNTSKQVIGDIELYAFDGTTIHTCEKDEYGIKYEIPKSVIGQYKIMNREKDIETIERIESYLRSCQ